MSHARLLSVEVERFKSYEAATRIDLAPLTVLVGRNNSGKSTLIQALLLLKQTLAHPRSDVPVHLEGPVDALTLRELISFGWAKEGERVPGPRICLRWRSRLDVGSKWLLTWQQRQAAHAEDWKALELETELCLELAEERGHPTLNRVTLVSAAGNGERHEIVIEQIDGRWVCTWDDHRCDHIAVEFDHFIPHLVLDRSRLNPDHIEQTLYSSQLQVFEQPLHDLEVLLEGFLYLESPRLPTPSVYRSGSVPPNEIGVSGEYAAQLIHARQSDVVHYLPPLLVDDAAIEIPTEVRARPFLEAINDVLSGLGVGTTLRIDELQHNLGFRLFFGNASLPHVGRGLTHLLPMVELGLFADPLRFQGDAREQDLEDYRNTCGYAHLAFEEPEAHFHPKVQTRLAHWMVALAMANRRIIVETHSDHFVRRLRGLMARAAPGSELEQWLRDNVSIVEVEQDEDGRSSLHASRLTPEGSLTEHWPADFMDEASDEERAIYYASLDKGPPLETMSIDGIEHDPGPEPDDLPP